MANKFLDTDSIKITPGIRDIVTKDDQARTMSAKEAIERGSTFLVIGRPITQAEDITRVISKNGRVILEIGYNQADDVIKIFESKDFIFLDKYIDINGLDRILTFESKKT